jgi:phage shock protein PspC (stress-responsive transcriptional regulator)
MLGGVCGGLSAYLRIDATFVRIFFVLLALADGIGVLLYMILWFVLPLEGSSGSSFERNVSRSTHEMAQRGRQIAGEVRQGWQTGLHPQLPIIAGVTLILVGAFSLLKSLGLAWLQWLDAAVIWPLLLIVAGIVLLIRRGREL